MAIHSEESVNQTGITPSEQPADVDAVAKASDKLHKKTSRERPTDDTVIVLTASTDAPLRNMESDRRNVYDPNMRIAMRRHVSIESWGSMHSLIPRGDVTGINTHVAKNGCMLIHSKDDATTKYLEDAVGFEQHHPTHKSCLNYTENGVPLVDSEHTIETKAVVPRSTSWRLNIEDFASKIVRTDQPEWKALSKKARGFYVRQNAVIQSYMEAEEKFDLHRSGLLTGADVTERASDLWTTRLSNIVNIILAISKLTVAILSGSMAIISSLVDSAVDLFTGAALWLASHRNRHHNPYLYPIGRQQLEPLAVTICSVVMIFASVQVIFESVRRLIGGNLAIDLSVVSIAIMACTIALKFGLFLYCRRVPTPISQALTLDHLNDVISNTMAVLCAILAEKFWLPLDPVEAIVMSLYIIFSWYRKGNTEAKALSGTGANANFLNLLTYIAVNHHPDIAGIETVTAYHMGQRMICEVDIVLCPFLSLPDAHDIAETLQMKIESLDDVERCFVHMDYELYHERDMEHVRH